MSLQPASSSQSQYIEVHPFDLNERERRDVQDKLESLISQVGELLQLEQFPGAKEERLNKNSWQIYIESEVKEINEAIKTGDLEHALDTIALAWKRNLVDFQWVYDQIQKVLMKNPDHEIALEYLQQLELDVQIEKLVQKINGEIEKGDSYNALEIIEEARNKNLDLPYKWILDQIDVILQKDPANQKALDIKRQIEEDEDWILSDSSDFSDFEIEDQIRMIKEQDCIQTINCCLQEEEEIQNAERYYIEYFEVYGKSEKIEQLLLKIDEIRASKERECIEKIEKYLESEVVMEITKCYVEYFERFGKSEVIEDYLLKIGDRVKVIEERNCIQSIKIYVGREEFEKAFKRYEEFCKSFGKSEVIEEYLSKIDIENKIRTVKERECIEAIQIYILGDKIRKVYACYEEFCKSFGKSEVIEEYLSKIDIENKIRTAKEQECIEAIQIYVVVDKIQRAYACYEEYSENFGKSEKIERYLEVLDEYLDVQKTLLNNGPEEALNTCNRFLEIFPNTSYATRFKNQIESNPIQTALSIVAKHFEKKHPLRALCIYNRDRELKQKNKEISDA